MGSGKWGIHNGQWRASAGGKWATINSPLSIIHFDTPTPHLLHSVAFGCIWVRAKVVGGQWTATRKPAAHSLASLAVYFDASILIVTTAWEMISMKTGISHRAHRGHRAETRPSAAVTPPAGFLGEPVTSVASAFYFEIARPVCTGALHFPTRFRRFQYVFELFCHF